MMRQKFLLLATFVIGITINISAQVQQEGKAIKKVAVELGSPLPVLKIQTLDTLFLTNKDLKTKGHLFLITINPTCNQCNNVGDNIRRHADLFKNSKVVFITAPENALNLDVFTNTTHISNRPELIVGVDKNKTIEQLDDEGSMPYINIYKNEKLIKKMNGDISLEDLKKYLP